MTIRGAEGRAGMPVAIPEGRRRNLREYGRGASNVTATKENSSPERQELMEAVVGRENMMAALKRVCANKGAPGVDGMRVEDLLDHCKVHWPRLKEELLAGRYQPSPVLGVEIPKAGGGMRQLGIPTAMDRVIQQAIQQVLTPLFDPGFSESSYGFRPGRSAHQAVLSAREHVAAGKRWIVDMDLEKFFDRVNHDVLMSRISRKVRDKRVLVLIRRYYGGPCRRHRKLQRLAVQLLQERLPGWDRVAVGDVFGDVYQIDYLATTVWEIGAPGREDSSKFIYTFSLCLTVDSAMQLHYLNSNIILKEVVVLASTLFESTLTDRYQTTIPKVVRETLGLGKGDRLKYTIDAGEVTILRADGEEENDPVLEKFLDFLARDMKQHPERIQAIDSDLVQRVTSLVQDVHVDLDQPLEKDHR